MSDSRTAPFAFHIALSNLIAIDAEQQLSVALSMLDHNTIVELVAEGLNPNTPVVVRNDDHQEITKDDEPHAQDYSAEHPLVFLLHHDMWGRTAETERKARYGKGELHDRIYECGLALLAQDSSGLSRIEHRVQDALGLTPADYAACSRHTDLAEFVIMDRIRNDIAKGHSLFLPDYYVLAGLYPDPEDGFAAHSMNVVEAVVATMDHDIHQAEMEIDGCPSPCDAWRLQQLDAIYKHWYEQRNIIDDIARGNGIFEDTPEMIEGRAQYWGLRGERANSCRIGEEALNFIAAINLARQKRARLIP